MNRKPSVWESFTDFISGKGFYLVVLLCVAVIGVSGYFLVRSFSAPQENVGPSAAAAGNTQLPAGSIASAVPSASAAPSVSLSPSASLRPSAKPSATVKPSASPAPSQPAASPAPTPAPSASAAPSAKVNPASRVFTWPVNGPVITTFSVEALLYDETMLDWRTHEGLDLAVEEGTRVLATAAGTVESVYDDDLMGKTIVIDHGKGLTSLYANLSEDTQVAAGDEVYTGDVIGAVGRSAAAESGRDSHLHFAIYLDDVPVNPEEYLPE